jgi:hypothetical protein
MSDADKIELELSGIIDTVSKIIGYSSNWSGVVKLVQDADFKGQKPFQCDILLHANLAGDEARWRTLLHEVLHSFSQGYNREDFENFRGWEEGVVEKLQRLLRPSVLSALAVTVEDKVFRALEEEHLYNSYLEALSELQKMSGQPEQQFYVNLLVTPIRDRPASIYAMSRRLTGQDYKDFMLVFSRTNSVLKGEIKWSLQMPTGSAENGSSV